MLFVGRHRELDWLRRSLAVSSRVLIQGPWGSGKRSLVSFFALSQDKKVVFVDSSSEVLGSDESLLVHVVDSGTQQFLNSQNYQKILGSQNSLVFVSHERFDAGFECPCLTLLGLSATDYREWISILRPDSNEQIDELAQQSHRLPAKTLELLGQSPAQAPKVFTSGQRTLAYALKILGQGDVSNLLRVQTQTEVSEIALSLKNDFLSAVQDPGTEDLDQSLLKALFKTLSDTERARLAPLYLKHCRDDWSQAVLDPKVLGELDFNSQDQLRLDLDMLCRSDSNHSLATIAAMRLAFVLGHREQATQLGQNRYLSLGSKPLSPTEQALFVEWVFVLNRSDSVQVSDVLTRLDTLVTEGTLKQFLTFEKVLYLTRSDLAARKTCLRELLEILPVESNSDSPWVNDFNATRLRAETLFQLARCGQMPQEAQEIRSLYQSAAQIFESQGHRYSAQVAQLNLCWLELSCQNWAQLNAACATLERMLQSNPQPYLEAGLNVVRSQKCRLHLQFSEALMHADRAQRLIPARAPIHTRLDVAVEKIRAYFFLGNRELAKSELQRIGADIQEASPSQRVQKQLESLRTELASLEADPTPGQLIVKSADTLYPLQLLVNAQARLEVPIELELSPLGELTALQVRLINTSSVQDREYLLDRLGAVVENSLDPLLEKIAFVLLKAQTTQDVSERHRQLDRALEFLKRSPADESAKAPLEHWHRSIERHEPLLVSGKLRRLPAIDRIRWGHWWRWARESSEAMPQQDLQLEIVESSGQTYDASLNDESQLMHFAAGLSISDVTGDVLMKGACISELKRRHNLRRVLICLLEMGQSVFDKSEFTKKVWGENYNPFVHDARIYTSIVRLRQMLPESVIETYGRGYRINPRVSWRLVRLASPGDQPRRGGLEHEILKAFESLEGSGRKWVGRSDIETLVNVSSAQLKRELKKLTESSLLERRGLGKQTLYSRLRQGALDRAQLQL